MESYAQSVIEACDDILIENTESRLILLLAVPRRLFCFGSLVVLDVVFHYLSLC